MISRTIDLNADLGEGSPWDEAILDRVSSANVSCGAHAGDPASIRLTLDAASKRGVVVGAHPGYADRAHFGRRDLDLPPGEIIRLIRDQVGELVSIAAEFGVSIRYIKPHGALYNQAQADPEIAQAVVEAAIPSGLPIVGQPGAWVDHLSSRAGHPFVGEGFADRRYRPDGRLVPRGDPAAILRDRGEIERQVFRFVDDPAIRTICLHGDNPEAIELADLVARTLRDAGVSIRGFA